jgi:two-component system phosphate regulon response regulator PhoB
MPREHILVIEDEADILELIRFNLAREGYRISTLL